MHIQVNPAAQQPLYRQIQDQISDAIRQSRLQPGDELEPAGELARRLVVSPGAVRKAYEELLAEGLCEGREASGYRVARVGEEELSNREWRRRIETLLERELLANEMAMARKIQERLLPPTELGGEGFAIAARSHPAGIVGGDFFDVMRHADGSIGLVVADVAGKGFAASLIMASVKATMPFVAEDRSVEATLEEMSRRLHAELGRREFVAMAYARFDPRRAEVLFANAGLPDPYLLRPGREPEVIEVPGQRLPLGLRPDAGYRVVKLHLRPGERLLLLTDGIPEAVTAAGEPLGYEAVGSLLASGTSATAEAGRPDRLASWLDGLLGGIRARCGGRLSDDCTILALEAAQVNERSAKRA